MKRSAHTLLIAGLTVLATITGTVVTPTMSTATTIQSQAVCSYKIYPGNSFGQGQVLNGSTLLIPMDKSAIRLTATENGKWKVTDKKTGKVLDHTEGRALESIEFKKGTYSVQFSPAASDCGSWKADVHIGPVEVFLGPSGNGQKLSQAQRIPAKPAQPLRFTANMKGKWSVGGLDLKVYETNALDVQIPDSFAGMSLPVTFEPNGGDDSTAVQVLLDVPGQTSTCSSSPSGLTMDVVAQYNAGSTPTLEKKRLESNTTIRLYQNPIYRMWVTIDSNRFLNGSPEYDEWDPGIWTVNNIVAPDNRLNWNHTALDLASYGKGTYKVTYTSKKDANRKWCGQVQLMESVAPKSGSSTCDRLESGVAPSPQNLRVVDKNGNDLPNNGTLTYKSVNQLGMYSSLSLYGTHAVYKGIRTVKKVKRSKTDLRTVSFADVKWQHEQLTFGEEHSYPGGLQSSRTKAEVYYNGDTLLTAYYPRKRKESDKLDGDLTINLQQIIAENGNKPGKYTLKVSNELSYQTCQIITVRDGNVKEVGTKTITQSFVTHIELKP